MRVMSEKQRNFIRKLVDERGAEGQVSESLLGGTAGMAEASAAIKMLLSLPFKESVGGVDFRSVPSGRYAAEVDGELRFFKVDNVAEGKWAGYVFVKVQAGPSFRSLGMQRVGDVAVRYSGSLLGHLQAIAADPKAASIVYGQESGYCGVCGRPLTDAVSLQRGMGPVCFDKFGAFA